MKKKVIAYLHTHWDREWYREYEVFRIRLLRVFDNVLNLFLIPVHQMNAETEAIVMRLNIGKALIGRKAYQLFIGIRFAVPYKINMRHHCPLLHFN